MVLAAAVDDVLVADVEAVVVVAVGIATTVCAHQHAVREFPLQSWLPVVVGARAVVLAASCVVVAEVLAPIRRRAHLTAAFATATSRSRK